MKIRKLQIRKFHISDVIIKILLLIVAALIILPFIWMVLTSFKNEMDIRSFPPRLFSNHYTLENYFNIWERIPFLSYYKNTIIFTGCVTAVSLFLDSMAGYAFARIRFKGRDIIFTLVLITQMIPFQVIMVPLYAELFHMKLINTYLGMILPRATNAFGIFMMRSFFVTLPSGLEEAARIDGASEFRIYSRIMLPLCKPALVTLGIFHFMYNWNDLLYPLIVCTRPEMRTLSAGLATFMGTHVVEYGTIMAGAVLTLLPIFIAYCAAQKQFVAGIALGGVKG